MTHQHCIPWLAALLLGIATSAGAADEALLRVLLKNKVITEAQFRLLTTPEAAVPAKPAPTEGSIAAKPAPAPDQGLLDVLLENNLISRAQYAALQVKTAEAKRTDPEAKASLKDGFKIKSQDGSFSVQPSAYAQLDSAFYGDGETDYSDGTQLRRTRLALAGTMFTDWDYKVEADFAGTTQDTGTTNEVTITDAYLRYNGWKPFAFTAGNFKVPFSLEAVSSAKYITFMERGLPFAFLTLRQLGGMAAANGDNWTGAVGLFGDSVTSENNDDEGKTVAARMTYAPLFQSDRVVHVGVAGAWREPAQEDADPFQESVRFRSKPESNILTDDLDSTLAGSRGRLVDTGRIKGDVGHFTQFGGELAGVWGPFSVQAEYIRTDVSRDHDDDLLFDGYYAYASWFLTGESRNYKADKGVFDILVPKRPFSLKSGGLGAWELAARYSNIDLNDADVLGGEEYNVTVGLNWYPISYVRFMANYVNVLDVEDGPHAGEDLDLFQLRAQVAY